MKANTGKDVKEYAMEVPIKNRLSRVEVARTCVVEESKQDILLHLVRNRPELVTYKSAKLMSFTAIAKETLRP